MALFFSVIVLKEPDKITLLPHASIDPNPLRNPDDAYTANGHTAILDSHDLLWLWDTEDSSKLVVDVEFLPKNKTGRPCYSRPTSITKEELDRPVKYWKIYAKDGLLRSKMEPWWDPRKVKKPLMALAERMLASDYKPPGKYPCPEALRPTKCTYEGWDRWDLSHWFHLMGGIGMAKAVKLPNGPTTIVVQQHVYQEIWRQYCYDQKTKTAFTISSPGYVAYDHVRAHGIDDINRDIVVPGVPPPSIVTDFPLPVKEL